MAEYENAQDKVAGISSIVSISRFIFFKLIVEIRLETKLCWSAAGTYKYKN